jgi:uncharacterized protein YjiS (DUF1127 family)
MPLAGQARLSELAVARLHRTTAALFRIADHFVPPHLIAQSSQVARQSDKAFADIGLTRKQANAEAARPFWNMHSPKTPRHRVRSLNMTALIGQTLEIRLRPTDIPNCWCRLRAALPLQ